MPPRESLWDRDATQVVQVVALFVGMAVAMFTVGRCSRPAYVSEIQPTFEIVEPTREQLDAVRQQLEADGMQCEQEADGFFWCTYPGPDGSEVAL